MYKMPKNLSAKENKARLQKKFGKGIKIFLKKKKSKNIVVNVTSIFQKMRNESLLSIEKSIIE